MRDLRTPKEMGAPFCWTQWLQRCLAFGNSDGCKIEFLMQNGIGGGDSTDSNFACGVEISSSRMVLEAAS